MDEKTKRKFVFHLYYKLQLTNYNYKYMNFFDIPVIYCIAIIPDPPVKLDVKNVKP